MKPFFSVIIPLYNKENYLKNTLNCVFNQTFVDFEVIVVNDGSTDNSIKVVEEYKDERLIVIHQKNQGVSVARNTGMAHANANYLCFLDADDTWKTNHLQVFYDTIAKFPEAKMYCGRYVTQISKNTFINNNFIDIEENYEGYVTDFFKSSLINRVALTSAVCIHKDIFTEIGGFDPALKSDQDLDYWIKIALKHKIAITASTTLTYNFINANKSLSKDNSKYHKLTNLNQYRSFEKDNKSLQAFLDIYRIEYGLHYYMLGLKEKSTEYLMYVDAKNMNFKTRFLLKLPPFLLNGLLMVKRKLRNYGIDFTVYH